MDFLTMEAVGDVCRGDKENDLREERSLADGSNLDGTISSCETRRSLSTITAVLWVMWKEETVVGWMVSLTRSLWSSSVDPPSMLTYSSITTKPSSLTPSDPSNGSIERTTDPVLVESEGRIDSDIVVVDVAVSLSWILPASAPSSCSVLSRWIAVDSSLAGSRLVSVWDVTVASVGAMVVLVVNAGEVAITDDEVEGEEETEGEEGEERG